MKSESITPNRRILVIDDNESIHQDFRKILNPATSGKSALAQAAAEIFGATSNGQAEATFEIDSAFQGHEGLEKVRQARAEGRPYAMAFVDLRMPPGWDGIETIERIWAEYSDLQAVICTAYSDYSLDQIIAKLGRSDKLLILKKPFDAIEVLQFADALTEKWRLSMQARARVEELEERVAERTQELREEHQKLLEARKMEAVGKLAGGIAHDFNSLLSAILGHAELIREESARDSLPYHSSVEIGKSASSAAALTHQILAFSRKQMLRPQRLDMNATIAAIEPKLRELVGERIEVTSRCNSRQPWTMTDAAQLQEVLVGLAENARDAMPRGGRLTIETADVTLTEADSMRERELQPGDYVTVSISDTGCGISEDVKPHVFEPYFSTKSPTEGRGLDLAMCYGMLKQSGGYITFKSEMGHGTTFKVFLPRIQPAKASASSQAPAAPVAPAAASAAPGARPIPAIPSIPAPGAVTGVILLVESDPALRGVASALLERQGYAVHRAEGGLDAMSVAKRLPKVDLLVADALMPGMTGEELASSLSAGHPAMKTIFTYAADDEKSSASYPQADFLKKPYAPALVAAKVREALNPELARV